MKTKLLKFCTMPLFMQLCSVSAYAVGREDSTEIIQKSADPTLVIAVVVFAVIVIAAIAIIIAVKANSNPVIDDEIIVVSEGARKSNYSKNNLPKHGTIIALDGQHKGKHFGIMTYAVLGRGDKADIKFNDKSVSTKHCRLDWNNGKLYITDLQSTNMTHVVGKGAIKANTPVELKNGDIFWLAKETNRFSVKIKG